MIHKINGKRGQITLFIIAGILIIVVIVLFFFLRKGIIPLPGEKQTEKPESFLDSCLEQNIREAINKILMQGGYIQNDLNIKLDGQEISFLCYTDKYYSPCINQEPMLIQHLRKETKDEINQEVRDCFDNLAESLETKGYGVEARYRDFEVEFVPGRMIVDIDGEMTLTKTGESAKEKDFRIIIQSRIYELAIVAQEIVSQEAKFCNFETIGFMLLYPDFKIEKFKTGDLNTIYTITHKKTRETFKFAIRGCVIPPGF